MTSATAAGGIRDGVPPPKNRLATLRAEVRRAKETSSQTNAGNEGPPIDRFMPDMRVEIAIRAFGLAKRPVNVNPQRSYRRGRSHWRNSNRRAKGPCPVGHGVFLVGLHFAEGHLISIRHGTSGHSRNPCARAGAKPDGPTPCPRIPGGGWLPASKGSARRRTPPGAVPARKLPWRRVSPLHCAWRGRNLSQAPPSGPSICLAHGEGQDFQSRSRRPAPEVRRQVAAAFALIKAFSAKVEPVSSGSGSRSSPAEIALSSKVGGVLRSLRPSRDCGWQSPVFYLS